MTTKKLQANVTQLHLDALDKYGELTQLNRTEIIKQWIEALPVYKELIEQKLKEVVND
jgi:hypothetical protein